MDMPTEAQIIPLETYYPNNAPIAPSLLEPYPDTVVLLEQVRTERRPRFAYAIGTRSLHIAYPVADQIVRKDIHFVPDDTAATKLREAFQAAQTNKVYGVALREAMLEAHLKITGYEPDQ